MQRSLLLVGGILLFYEGLIGIGILFDLKLGLLLFAVLVGDRLEKQYQDG